MTKKHFEAIAKAVRNAHAWVAGEYEHPTQEAAAQDGIGIVTDFLANVCESFNPRFDRDRFIAACRGD